jgi:hypothetical protein
MASRSLPLTKSDVVNLALYSAVQPSVKGYTVHKKACAHTTPAGKGHLRYRVCVVVVGGDSEGARVRRTRRKCTETRYIYQLSQIGRYTVT